MGRIWSDQRRYETWLLVETAAAEAMAAAGIVPADAARDIRERGAFDIARIEEIEQTTQHDVIAFTTAVAENVGPSARWLHFGLTSSDVIDTAQALQMREACDLILEDLDALAEAVRDRAIEHRRTPMIGRTHGVHAEPMTFGLKLALWYAELERDVERVRARARDGQRRQAVRRGRHVRAPAAVDRSRRLPPARPRAGAGRVAGDSARSARGAAGRARDHRGVAREVRARDSRPAEDRDRRGRGAVRARARRARRRCRTSAIRSAASRSSGWRGSFAATPRGVREHRALARARHLALVGRARDPARQLHRARSHAAPLHAHRSRHGRVSGSDARESEALARRRVLGHRAARAGQEGRLARAGVRVGAAQRHALVRRAARFQGAAARRSGRRRACCRAPRSSARSISTSSSKHVDHDFRPGLSRSLTTRV